MDTAMLFPPVLEDRHDADQRDRACRHSQQHCFDVVWSILSDVRLDVLINVHVNAHVIRVIIPDAHRRDYDID
jgi:hypothetical protein